MGIHHVYTGRNISMEYEDFLHQFAEIAMSPRILAACLDFATERALPEAFAISPQGPTGSYRDSWKVYPSTAVVKGMRRVCARLINTSPHAALVEWGGKPGGGTYAGRYRPAQHILQQVRDRLTGRDGATDPDLLG